jgi:hypothetical protein
VAKARRWRSSATPQVERTKTVEEDDYYTLMAQATAALDPNTGEARRRLYERARAALLTELRSADPSDVMAAQMLLEIGYRRGRGGRSTRPALCVVHGFASHPARP